MMLSLLGLFCCLFLVQALTRLYVLALAPPNDTVDNGGVGFGSNFTVASDMSSTVSTTSHTNALDAQILQSTKSPGIGGYIASGLAIQKPSTSSQTILSLSSSTPSTSSDPSLSGNADDIAYTTHYSTSQYSGNTSTTATTLNSSNARDSTASTTSRNLSQTRTSITRSAEMFQNSHHNSTKDHTLIATKTNTLNNTDCWAQWTSFWSQSLAATGEWVSVSGSFTTFVTSTTDLPWIVYSETLVYTLTTTLIDEGHSISTYVSL
ncbi:hypothetical protein EV356DRAFT_232821 [Viridothelium virens]|uniref:Uncharacterized protein n=1 Tax=Viridothelium virens TaxID=1048519 RepID=A0A6A6H4X3_VIRVR|nr:hypothetical protein EV356DRAFT_232821 [Viridothelium virens]